MGIRVKGLGLRDKGYGALVLLVVVCAALFANTFGNPFIWDEQGLVIDNNYIKSLKHIPFLFSPGYWNNHSTGTKGQYRPLRTLTFSLDYSLWGLNPKGYHLTNLLIHTLNVILIYFLILLLPGSNRGLSFLCALFFAAHPIHTESITWIKNRSDLLSLFFFILSFHLFIRYTQNRTRAPNPNPQTLYIIPSLFYGIPPLQGDGFDFSLSPVFLRPVFYDWPRPKKKPSCNCTIF